MSPYVMYGTLTSNAARQESAYSNVYLSCAFEFVLEMGSRRAFKYALPTWCLPPKGEQSVHLNGTASIRTRQSG
jgi:hypothetical protein